MNTFRTLPFKKILFYTNIVLSSLLLLGSGWLIIRIIQPAPTASNGAGPTEPSTLQPGQAAPDFTLDALQGPPIHLADQTGQVVIVNLWATWCPPCRAEMPMLDAFQAVYVGQGVTVLAVNSEEDVQTVQDFITKNGFTFQVLLDPQAEMQVRFGVLGLPTTFVIDRQGVIQAIHLGEITEEQLKAVVEPLL